MPKEIQLIQDLPGYRLMRNGEYPNYAKGDMFKHIDRNWLITTNNGQWTVKECLFERRVLAYARKIN